MNLQNGFLLNDQLVLPVRNEIEGPGGGRRRVSDAAMRVLLLLCEAHSKVVPRAQLRAAAGDGAPVSSDRLVNIVHELRDALGDDARHPQFIKTLRYRGYRLVCRVRTASEKKAEPPSHPIFHEIWRRRVFRVSGAYLAGAWVILQVVNTLEDARVLPSGTSTWTVALIALGFPIAVAAAWTLQVGNHGVHVDHGDPDDPKSDRWQWLDVGVIGISILAFGLILWRLIGADHPATPPDYEPIENSVAVLPFVALGPTAPDVFFAQGLTEEIINLLALLDGVQVMSRSATFSFSDQNIGSREIARKLRAKLLVEGSVRRMGDKVRVRVQLIDGPNTVIIWSGRYELPLTNVLQIQDELAAAVARQMKGVLSEQFRTVLRGRGADDPRVIELTYNGRGRLHAATTIVDLQKALREFRSAQAIAPAYPPALAGECEVHLALYVVRSDPEDFSAAERACRNASTFAGNEAETESALGRLYLAKGEADEALAHFDSALKIRPTMTDAMIGRADALSLLDRGDDATQVFLRALDAEPGYWRAHYRFGKHLYEFGCYELAIEQFEEVLRVRPGDTTALNSIAAAQYLRGEFGKAAVIWRDLVQSGPPQETYSNVGTMFYFDGNFTEAINMYRRAIALAPEIHWFHGGYADALLAANRAAEAAEAYGTAIELAKNRLSVNKTEAKTMSSLAHYLASAGRTDEALRMINDALQLDDANGDIHYDAALVYVAVKDPDRAITHVGKALANGFQVVFFRADPTLASLRQHAAYSSTVQKYAATVNKCPVAIKRMVSGWNP